MRSIPLIILLLVLDTAAAFAAPKAAPEPDAVLDFEADVIDGEKRMPSIFLQTSAPQADLESVLFLRKDFNTFHRNDLRWTPGFVPELPTGGTSPSQGKGKR